jgi:2-polyprenyl-3-methyl-5-hydroxy-6-metoxy-1,4-benzoquinol methylase
MLNSTYKITKNTIKSAQSTQKAQGGALLVATTRRTWIIIMMIIINILYLFRIQPNNSIQTVQSIKNT